MLPFENTTLTGHITSTVIDDWGCSNEVNLQGFTMGDSEIGRMSRVEATKETVTVPSRVTASDIASEHGIDDSDEEQENVEFRYKKIGVHQFAPTIAEAEAAFADIKKILKPPRKKGHSYKHHGLDELTHSRVEAMRRFLWKYVAGKSTTQWIAASLETALLKLYCYALSANRLM